MIRADAPYNGQTAGASAPALFLKDLLTAACPCRKTP